MRAFINILYLTAMIILLFSEVYNYSSVVFKFIGDHIDGMYDAFIAQLYIF